MSIEGNKLVLSYKRAFSGCPGIKSRCPDPTNRIFCLEIEAEAAKQAISLEQTQGAARSASIPELT